MKAYNIVYRWFHYIYQNTCQTQHMQWDEIGFIIIYNGKTGRQSKSTLMQEFFILHYGCTKISFVAGQ